MENILPSLLGFRQAIKTFKPSSEDEAVKLIHLISDISAADKELKKAAYDLLDKSELDEIITEDGLTVKKIQNENKVYKKTKAVEDAETRLELAKKDLQNAKDRAGFKLEKGASYWKVSR